MSDIVSQFVKANKEADNELGVLLRKKCSLNPFATVGIIRPTDFIRKYHLM